MKEYAVWFKTMASIRVEVEAEDIEGAENAAFNIHPGGLCHHCARIDLGEWEIDEIEETAS